MVFLPCVSFWLKLVRKPLLFEQMVGKVLAIQATLKACGQKWGNV